MSAITNLRFDCAWAGEPPVCTGPDSGEALEAQGWENETDTLLIGTEDQEVLSARLDQRISLTAGSTEYPIEYFDRGLAVCIPRIPPHVDLSLHFVVAWNPLPEPADSSCWYAVDIPHQRLMAILPEGEQNIAPESR